jgi:hypothetical protein
MSTAFSPCCRGIGLPDLSKNFKINVIISQFLSVSLAIFPENETE